MIVELFERQALLFYTLLKGLEVISAAERPEMQGQLQDLIK